MHPKTTDYFRVFLAKRNMFLLVIVYLVIIIFISGILGLLLWSTGDRQQSYVLWWQFAFLQLFDSDLPGIQINPTSNQHIVYIFGAILKVILPVLLLGAVVFKLFIHPDVFIFRKKISVYFSKNQKKNTLAIKLYSSTKLTIVNVNFRAIARISFTSPVTGNLNRKHEEIRLKRDYWPLATTHLPYMLLIPLDDADIVQIEGVSKLVSIQQHKFEEPLTLIIIISAHLPEIGTEMIEKHVYQIPDQLEWGEPASVVTDFADVNRTKNYNWKDFEKIKFDNNQSSQITEH